MEDRDEIQAVTRVVQPSPTQFGQRGLQKFGDAESALRIEPRILHGAPRSWATDWTLGGDPRDLYGSGDWETRRRRRHLESILAQGRRPIGLSYNPQPPVGPPYLLGFPLYDGRNKELHELFDGFAQPLDAAAGAGIHLCMIANPTEVYQVGTLMHPSGKTSQQIAGAQDYLRKLRQGQSAEHVRMIEVAKLAEFLHVKTAPRASVAFLPFPFTRPAGVLPIEPEWLADREMQRKLATALELFFGAETGLADILGHVSTNVELVKAFESRAIGWFTTYMKTASQSPGDAVVLDDAAWYTATQLAERFNIEREPLRKKLERFQGHNDPDWIEAKDRPVRAERFLYRLGAVRGLLESSKASINRPGKKL